LENSKGKASASFLIGSGSVDGSHTEGSKDTSSYTNFYREMKGHNLEKLSKRTITIDNAH
jgi:hypothetical protein